MLRLKSSTLLLAGLLSAAVIPLASAAPDAHPDAAEHGKPRFAEKIAEHRAERLDALFDSWGLDDASRDAFKQAQQEYREQRQALRQGHRERIGEILDQDQIEALQAMMRPVHSSPGKHRSKQHGPGEQGMHADERIDALFTSWELSDDERATLASAHEQFMTQARELHDQQFDSRDTRRDAWKSLRDEHRQALNEVLSDEQVTVLEHFMAPRHHHRDAARD